MSNKPARFRQSELARAIRAARDTGARLAIVDGTILIDPQGTSLDKTGQFPEFPQDTDGNSKKIAKGNPIRL